MKALVDRLEWIQMYVNGQLGKRDDPTVIQIAQDELIALLAIAAALPEITISVPGQPVDQRKPPERIVDLPGS